MLSKYQVRKWKSAYSDKELDNVQEEIKQEGGYVTGTTITEDGEGTLIYYNVTAIKKGKGEDN